MSLSSKWQVFFPIFADDDEGAGSTIENEAFERFFKHFCGIARYEFAKDGCHCPDSKTRIQTPELNLRHSSERGAHSISREFSLPREALMLPDGLIPDSTKNSVSVLTDNGLLTLTSSSYGGVITNTGRIDVQ